MTFSIEARQAYYLNRLPCSNSVNINGIAFVPHQGSSSENALYSVYKQHTFLLWLSLSHSNPKRIEDRELTQVDLHALQKASNLQGEGLRFLLSSIKAEICARGADGILYPAPLELLPEKAQSLLK